MSLKSASWSFAILLCACLAMEARDWSLPWTNTHVLKREAISAETGRAYTAALPGDMRKASTTLFEGRYEKAPPLAFADGLLGWSRVYYYLNGVLSARFPGLGSTVRWTAIGVGSQAHDDIRRRGSGLYSAWAGALYFSTPDGSDPRTNGRVYRLDVQPEVPTALRITLWVLCLAFGVLSLLRLAEGRQGLKAHMPGIWISLAMVALLFAAGEVYLRATVPFTERTWPSLAHPVAGVLLKPGAEVQHTNDADFWIRQTANSLGFLDREPAMPKPAGTYRILVLGDSMVEAAQVAMDRKFHVLLEGHLRRAFPGRAIDVVALGYSGTGQASQLTYYEVFAPKLQPDLVINLVVNNDYANNSPLLEAVRQGWHPAHPPRPTLETDPSGRGFRRRALDPEWKTHLIHVATHDRVRDQADRIAILAREPRNAKLLEGWKYPNDLDIDEMFCADDLPAAFRQAIEMTDHAFTELAGAVRRDGGKLLLVATEHHTAVCKDADAPRKTRKDGLMRHVRNSAQKAGAPLVDLYPAFAAKGDNASARFRFDPHWSETGHRWAAEALLGHFQRHPELLVQ